MDNALSALLSTEFIFFCLMISGVTYVLRVVVEYFSPKLYNSKAWNDLIMPIMPILLGATVGVFAKLYPYPTGVGSALSSRVIFGFAGGLLGSQIYRFIKTAINLRIGTKDDCDNDERPAPLHPPSPPNP